MTARTFIYRILLTLNAAVVACGGFLADMNVTHIYNPRWPRHAKFHDGQTMAMGVLLAMASLFFVWRPAGDGRTNVIAAAIFAEMLYWSQALANLFPGTAWTDPEFLKPGETLDMLAPQLYLDGAMALVITLAAALVLVGQGPSPSGKTHGTGGVG